MTPDQPLTWPPKLRNMACELYRLGGIHKARENRLVEAGLARVECGHVRLKPHVWMAIEEMHK